MVTGFELATSMTVNKRFFHYATNFPCDWYVHITFKMLLKACIILKIVS